MMRLLALAAACLAVTACDYASPGAGEQGVMIRHPWFFGSGGVDPQPISTGSTIKAMSTKVVYIPVTPIAFEIKLDNMMPSDGIPLDFNAVVRMQVEDAPALVANWNGAAVDDKEQPTNSWFWDNINPLFSNIVRQDVKQYDMSSLAFGGQAIDQIDAHVTAQLNDFIHKNHMPVRLLSVTVGRAMPPQEILNQRTETAAQTQRQKTMDATRLAEDARKGAEESRAAADNAYREKMGLSPEQYVELQRIEMQKTACAQGTCIFGNGTALVSQK